MDRFIRRLAAQPDGDLMRCEAHGVAYQRDMAARVAYDAAYHAKCAAYDAAIARRVVEARIAFVARHYTGAVLDVGAGAGQFVAARAKTFGYDVNPESAAQLQRVGLYAENLEAFGALTFWDVLEHVAAPAQYFDRIRAGAYVFASLPVFAALGEIRGSKHYRPGEHLYYWTEAGFVTWMALYGFHLLEASHHETDAGRAGIRAFAFKRGT